MKVLGGGTPIQASRYFSQKSIDTAPELILFRKKYHFDDEALGIQEMRKVLHTLADKIALVNPAAKLQTLVRIHAEDWGSADIRPGDGSR
jgi:hypothetical protein